MNKATVALLLAVSSSICAAAPIYLVCSGSMFDNGAEKKIDDITVAVDYHERRTVTLLGNDYEMHFLTDQTIGAGAVVKNGKLSTFTINLHRITGALTVLNSDATVQYRGTCRVTSKKF